LKPTGREELRTGDVLALTGTHDAIEAATAILCDRGSAADVQRARRDLE
jgi:hypothetical protein